jgi:excisionase family DNA binding protein
MPKLLTPDELCEYLQVSKSTLRKWCASDRIPHSKMPNGSVRFDQAAIDRWIKLRSVTVNSLS